MKERKTNLLTVRLTEDESSTLDYLCDSMGKSKSDVISRTCMYFLNTRPEDVIDSLAGSGTDEKDSRKTIRVHARVSDSLAEDLKSRSIKDGEGLSRTVRKAIRSFASMSGIHY